MLSSPGPSPHVMYGQGRSATTLLTEGGYHYPVVDASYNDRTRVQSAPYQYGRGLRPMHQSTLTIGKAPWNPKDAYTTSSKEFYGGSKKLNPVRRPPRCPSMHTSQWDIGQRHTERYWEPHYKQTFVEKDIIPATVKEANRLHLTSLVNRIDQTEGGEMKDTIEADPSPTNYWSQYNRVHNKLGNTLGPGVPRSYPVRQSYNVLTGEETGPAWKEANKRVSGNRFLSGTRVIDDSHSILG